MEGRGKLVIKYLIIMHCDVLPIKIHADYYLLKN